MADDKGSSWFLNDDDDNDDFDEDYTEEYLQDPEDFDMPYPPEWDDYIDESDYEVFEFELSLSYLGE